MQSPSNQQGGKAKPARESKPKNQSAIGMSGAQPVHPIIKYSLNPSVGKALWGGAAFIAGCIIWNHADNPIVWSLIPCFLSLLLIWLAAYRRIVWDRRGWRKPTITVASGIVVVWVGYFAIFNSVFAQPQPPPRPFTFSEKEQSPTTQPATQSVGDDAGLASDTERGTIPHKKRFRILGTTAVIHYGPLECVIPLGWEWEGKTFDPLVIKTEFGPPVTFILKDSVVYPNAIISDGMSYIKVEQGDLDFCPPDWDFNQDGRALEVIDRTGRVIFQMEYISGTELSIRGIFQLVRGKYIIITDKYIEGQEDTEDAKKRVVALPIFRYPSAQFSGKRINAGADQNPFQ
jgi:hypothetical protein